MAFLPKLIHKPDDHDLCVVHELRSPRMVLGRHPACDVVLYSNKVRRHHAVFEVVGEVVLLDSLNARIGVRVNGSRVDRGPLSNADIVDVADVRFVFLDRDDRQDELTCKSFLSGTMSLPIFNDWREERGYWSPPESADA